MWQHDLYAAYVSVGDILLAQGDPSGASNAYRGALSNADALANSAPADANRQAELRDAYTKSAAASIGQDDVAAALDSLEAARDIAERLVRADPADTAYQRDLAVVLNGIGDARAAKNDRQCLVSYHQALAIIERLLKSDPGNALWQQDALWTNWRLATFGDDPLRRWTFIVTTLRETAGRNALTVQQAKWLPEAERQLAKLKRQ